MYQNTVKKIKDQFGDRLLTSITRDELQKWLNDFGKSHAINTKKILCSLVQLMRFRKAIRLTVA
ncbi:hypothetical protein JNW93_12585 [Lacticaseibacillus rhamnosus]|nr:hypothetical protein [Lacticaseibacillus rhamnosus]